LHGAENAVFGGISFHAQDAGYFFDWQAFVVPHYEGCSFHGGEIVEGWCEQRVDFCA
jgi:hypothetical protein